MNGQEENLTPEMQQLFQRLRSEQLQREEERRTFQREWLGEVLRVLQEQVDRMSQAVQHLQFEIVPQQGQTVKKQTEEMAGRIETLAGEVARLGQAWKRSDEQRGRLDGELRQGWVNTLEQERQRQLQEHQEETRRTLEVSRQLQEEQIAAYGRLLEQAVASIPHQTKAAIESESPALREEMRERLLAVKNLLQGPLAELPGEMQAWERRLEEQLTRQLQGAWEQGAGPLREELHQRMEPLQALLQGPLAELPGQLRELRQAVERPLPTLPEALEQPVKELAARAEEMGRARWELARTLQEGEEKLQQSLTRGETAWQRLLQEQQQILPNQLRQVLQELTRLVEHRTNEEMARRGSEIRALGEKIAEDSRSAVQAKLKQWPRKVYIGRFWLALVAGLFILALFSPWAAHWLLSPEKSEEVAPPVSHRPPLESAVNSFLPSPSLAILDGSLQRSESLDVAGEAPWGSFILLLANGQEKALRFVENRRFEFRQIELGSGEWMLQAVAFDSSGRSSVSDTVRLVIDPSGPNLSYIGTPNSVSSGLLERRELALTFDAGSSDREAQAVLDILRAEGLRTTIFLTGQFIDSYPELVRRMVADGHQLGNHTYDHPHLTTYGENGLHHTVKGVDRNYLVDQLRRTADAFERVTGRRLDPFWRAPYGEFNQELVNWAAAAGYKHVHWTKRGGFSLDSLTWVVDRRSPLYFSAVQMRDRFLKFEDQPGHKLNGGIALFHLASDRDRDNQTEVLPDLIRGLRKRGLKLITVGELIRP